MEYSDELARAFCQRIEEVGGIETVCKEPGMPGRSTINYWRRTKPDFNNMVMLAKECFAELEFDRLETLAMQDPPKDADGRIDHGWVLRQKMIVDTKKWILARLCPKRYSERVELTAAEGKPLIADAQVLTHEQMIEGARRLAFMLNRADALVRNGQGAQPLRLAHELKLEAQ